VFLAGIQTPYYCFKFYCAKRWASLCNFHWRHGSAVLQADQSKIVSAFIWWVLTVRAPAMSSTSDAVDETSRAWTAGKSPLPFQVRCFIGRTGHEVLILTDRCRGPAFYPTLFMTCYYDKSGYPANTRLAVLRALGMA
jgi:hypothetical protein